MSTTAVPMFDPNGDVRMVPHDQVGVAMANGGKVAITFAAPDGTTRYVPHDQMQQAMAAGGKMVPVPSQPTQFEQERDPSNQQGVLSTAASALGNMAKGAFSQVRQTIANTGHGLASAQAREAAARAQADAMTQQNESEMAAGYGLPYRVAAGAASAIAGTNVPNMEHQADIGNARGVIGEALAPAAVAMAPLAADGLVRATGPTVQRYMGAAAPDLYRSALKPTTVPSQQPAVQWGIQTGLAHEIPVSAAGAEKLSGLIEDTNNKIAAAINADPTRKISSEAAASRVDSLKSQFANQVNPSDDLAAIEASKQEFRANQGARKGSPAQPPRPTGLLDAQGNPVMSAGTPATPDTPAQPMNADDAQAMKMGTYQQLKGKSYGELKTASIEAQKALARGLKEELATAFPELSDLNAKDSAFFNLDPILERAVARISNHQLIGIGTPAAGMAAKAMTGSGAMSAVAGVIKAVVDNPNVKSRLAIMLNRASKGQITVPQAMARVAAYSGALSQDAHADTVQPEENQATQ